MNYRPHDNSELAYRIANREANVFGLLAWLGLFGFAFVLLTNRPWWLVLAFGAYYVYCAVAAGNHRERAREIKARLEYEDE